MNMQVDDEVIEHTTIDDDAPSTPEDRGDNFTPEAVEVTPQEQAPAAPAGDEGGKAAAHMIPKGRFDEVNLARKQAEEENQRLLAELAALRNGSAPAAAEPSAAPAAPAAEPAPDIAELERQRIAAMMDGDEEKAVEIGIQITGIVREQARQETLREIEGRNTQAAFEQSIDEAVNTVIGQYPQFDDTGDQANPEAIEAMVAMRNHYITEKGMTPAQAIVEASNKVAKMFGFGGEAPAIDPRTRAAIERGAAVTAAQPNTTAVGVGTRQDTARLNIHDMDDEQFDALSDAEKRRLRGD